MIRIIKDIWKKFINKMNKGQILIIKFIIYSTISIVGLFIVFLISKSEDVKSFCLNLMTEVIGFIITVVIFEKILREYNEISELKKSKIVAIQFNKMLQQYIDIFADIYKSTAVQPNVNILDKLEVFFGRGYFEQIEDFDWNSNGPSISGSNYDKENGYIIHHVPWHEYLQDNLKNLEAKFSSTFEKYSAWMSNEMLVNYSQLIDTELSKSIAMGKMTEKDSLKVAQQSGIFPIFMRFPFFCGYFLYKTINVIIKIDNFNRNHFSDINQLTVNKNLWTNNIAPSIGSSRIKPENEQMYSPKNIVTYDKLCKL